jgi:hypothetical protein
MHATAQALAKAWISQQHPSARLAEVKRLLFFHFYGNDFEPEQRKRIASALLKKPPSRRSAGAGQVNNSQTALSKSSGRLEDFRRGHRLGKRRGLWSKGKDQN